MKKLSYLIFLTILACPLVLGQPGNGSSPNPGGHFFEMHDVDGNGQVTMDEFLAQAQTRFGKLDGNGDGVITDADFADRKLKAVASRMVIKADTDQSKTVTAQEWTTFVDGLESDENGVIDPNQFHGRRGGHGRGGHGSCHAGDALDMNDSGGLDAEDLAQIFDALDANQDQIVGEDELVPSRRGQSHRDGCEKAIRGSGRGSRHSKRLNSSDST